MQEYRNSPMENYSNGFPEERNVQSSPFYGSQKETINFSLLYRCRYKLQNSSSFRVSGFGAFGISGQWSKSCIWIVEMFFNGSRNSEENLIPLSQRGKAKMAGHCRTNAMLGCSSGSYLNAFISEDCVFTLCSQVVLFGKLFQLD